jgi:hypothetical protein
MMSLRLRIVIDGDGISADEADGYSLAERAGRPPVGFPVPPVLLKHDGSGTELEPTPANVSFRTPLPRHSEPESIYINRWDASMFFTLKNGTACLTLGTSVAFSVIAVSQ